MTKIARTHDPRLKIRPRNVRIQDVARQHVAKTNGVREK